MTVISDPTRLYTPDDLLELESEGLFELVDGKLVEKQMSSLASKTAARVTLQLGEWNQYKFGEIYPEQTFRCFPHKPQLIRRPDIAFIMADRLLDVPDEGHVPIAPDLAVEIISPNDSAYEVDEKLLDYRIAGVKLVWVVNPHSRIIRVHRLDRSITEIGDADTLAGEGVLPGFSAAVRNLVPPRST